MATYQDPPPLPRSPTILRRNAPSLSAPPPPPPPLSAAHRDLPLPPRFPSMNDVTPAWRAAPPDAPSPESVSVAWERPLPDAPPSAPSDPDDVHSALAGTPGASADAPPDAPPEKAPGVLAALAAKVKALLPAAKKKKKKPEAEDAVKRPPRTPAREKKPPLVAAKELVCKMPDPTLVFVLEAALMLVLHLVRPACLRTWPARILAPLLLVPTVAATALWRPTRVISLKDVPEYTSAAKPIPNAGAVVSRGESLRARQAAVGRAEEELRMGQMRLEVLRKEIEGRLPPQVSIANLLDTENDAARANDASA